MRIVDLAMGWAGPLATRQLADLGAEIIKVEGCAYPDWWRGQDYSPESMAGHLYEKRMWFNVLNRNKTGITLDLTRPQGADLLRRLVEGADAVIENYSQGVLPKLGLAYADLVKIKPDLVMVSMPAFGGSTAWRDVRAYGSTLEQGSGLPSVAGTDDLPPVMNHVAYGDPIGGMNAGAAALLALLHKKRTGQGQYCDLSQIECMFPLVAAWVIEQSVTGKVVRRGNRHPLYAPNGVFPCAGPDRWIAVSVTSDANFAALCGVIGRPDLGADPTLATTAGRAAQQDMLEAAIAIWTRTQDAEAAMAALQRAGIAAGVAWWPGELISREPHLAARGHWQMVDRAWLGPHPQPSLPFRMNGAPILIRTPAPTLGQYTEDVLRRLLGLDDAELAVLRDARIIGTEAIPATERKPRSAALARAAAAAG
jgi:crotonobetainyl-CoA:carnitine CoA-transferase CaiB-like acyl-CoA transferase